MGGENGLGEFLRSRRTVVPPEAATLLSSGTRRVNGLRREEVARLAGVSRDYYTRLEQGRERHPSDQVLAAMARALRLDRWSSDHLFRLAKPTPAKAAIVCDPLVADDLSRLIQEDLDQPACVVGPGFDVLATNRYGTALYSDFERFDNLLRMTFLDPAAQLFYPNWQASAKNLVGAALMRLADFPEDESIIRIVTELTGCSPEFDALWRRHDVSQQGGDLGKAVRHSRVGLLRLELHRFDVAGSPGQRLYVASAPAGSDTARAIAKLVEHEEPSAAEPEPQVAALMASAG